MSFRRPAHEIGGPWNKTLPVHENMTLLALKRVFDTQSKKNAPYKGGILLSGVDSKELPDGRGKSYVDPKDAPLSTQEFLRGVTWPDDPKGWLFDSARGTTNYSSGTMWYNEFEGGSLTNPEHLIKRSHYGDLQFFHSMAVALGEAASTTKGKILEWARFNVELALGKVDFKTRVEDLPSRFNSIQIYFRGHCAWQIRALLAGSEDYGKQLTKLDVQQRATGILLHMLQDSFSHSHVERQKDGAIEQFHDYGSQDGPKHSEKDHMGTGDTLAERMKHTLGASEAIDAGARLVRMLDASSPVDDVMKLIDKELFKLSSTATAAGPGENFKKVPKKKSKWKLW